MAAGLFTTAQLTADHAQKSFSGMITKLMPNGSAPLFALTSFLKEEMAAQTEHGFFSKAMVFPEMKLNGAITNAATTITVISTTNILPGMIFRIESTKENIIVNTVASSTSITVTRGVGSVAAAAAADQALLYQVGNAFEEASVRPNALNIQPVKITNLTQIFRNSWGVSETIRATLMVTGESNQAENKQDCAAFHAVDIEKALLFGQKSTGTRNGQPFRTMEGLIAIVGNLAYYPSSYSAANVSVAGSTTNYTQLETILDPVFNQTTDPKGASERVLFVGGTANKVINSIGRLNGQYQLVDGQTSFGLQFSSFKISRGTFRVIEHPLFNTNADWSKMAIAVDLPTFSVAYLGNRKTQHKAYNAGSDATDSGIDAQGGTLTTEMTCLIKNPPANAVVYGLTAGAVG